MEFNYDLSDIAASIALGLQSHGYEATSVQSRIHIILKSDRGDTTNLTVMLNIFGCIFTCSHIEWQDDIGSPDMFDKLVAKLEETRNNMDRKTCMLCEIS